MSTVAEIIERREHNKRVRLAHASTFIQERWGNLSFLYVSPLKTEPCPRCRRSDPIDRGEMFLDRWGVARRCWPMLSPDQITEVVKAGMRAESEALDRFQGGNNAKG